MHAHFRLLILTICVKLSRGLPLYINYMGIQRVGCLRRFGLKTGTHFAHSGLESGMVF